MKTWLALLILLLPLVTFAAQAEERCNIDLAGTAADTIEERLAQYFGREWLYGDSLSDADAAKRLLADLRKSGTTLDFQIFETYLSVLESTTGRYFVRTPGFYVDELMGQRPKSTHFQERHWDWNIFHNYFFNSPSSISATKHDDLEYLHFVLATAKTKNGRATLKQTLQIANAQRALKRAESRKLSSEYQAYTKGKTYTDLARAYTKKLRNWAEAGGRTHKADRLARVKNTIDAFRNSNSTFDLFLSEKYFDLTVALQVTAFNEPLIPVLNCQLTDMHVFTMGLPAGSVDYVTHFLFQNSHDVEIKNYFYRIMAEMEKALPSHRRSVEDGSLYGEGPFYDSFLAAKDRLDSKLPDIPAPELYQADLHIFSSSEEGYGGNGTEVIVRWDKKLGKLQSNVSWQYPHLRNANVGNNRKLADYIKKYFNHFREKNVYSKEKIDFHENGELNTPLADSTFLVFTKPGTDEMLTIIRILNGQNRETFIEQEFSVVHIVERDQNIPVYEIGRLLAEDDVEGNSLELIMARVAEFFSNTNMKGMAYFDGNRPAHIYHRRNGATLVYEPKQLHQAPEDTPVWIMKMTIQNIIAKFMKPAYQTVRVRRSTP